MILQATYQMRSEMRNVFRHGFAELGRNCRRLVDKRVFRSVCRSRAEAQMGILYPDQPAFRLADV